VRRLTLFLASVTVAVGIAASTATANVCACGGNSPPYVVYYIAYYPNPTGYSNGQRWCEYHWSNGVITNSPC
jgi:hypothetical protein